MKPQAIIVKSIFTISLMTMFLVFASCRSEAQSTDSKKTAEERARRLTEKMKTELSLTEDQYPKVEEINLKYAKKNEEIMKSSAGKFSKYKSLKSSRRDKSKDMKTVLSKEQFEKYEQLTEEMENEAKERYRNKNG